MTNKIQKYNVFHTKSKKQAILLNLLGHYGSQPVFHILTGFRFYIKPTLLFRSAHYPKYIRLCIGGAAPAANT